MPARYSLRQRGCLSKLGFFSESLRAWAHSGARVPASSPLSTCCPFPKRTVGSGCPSLGRGYQVTRAIRAVPEVAPVPIPALPLCDLGQITQALLASVPSPA